VTPLPEAPVVSAHLWFDAGAADETPSEHGAAHFVEHLLFKGTERRPVGGSAGTIEGLGGDLNAWTSYDETTLHATALADGADEVLDVLIDMARHAVFDPDEVERERQVVLEELRGYADDPESVAADHLQHLVFRGHAYGRPIIGTEASVSALSRDDLVGFWRRHYHPGRAGLAVAGPVDPEAIRQRVQELTAGWPEGASRGELSAPEAPRRRLQLVDRDFGSVVVQLGYPGPAVDDPDVAALDVLLAGLGQGSSSRLHTRLDLQAGVASQVWAQAQPYRRGGLVSVSFFCGETEEALALAHDILSGVGERGLDAAEVQRARDGLLADLLFASETTDGIAGELAWSMARLGHPRGLQAYREALREVTPAEVTRVARRYLDADALQVVVIDREITASTLERQIPPEPPPRRERQPRAARPSGPSTVDVRGLRVALWPDDSEVVGLKIVGFGGQILEEARLAGSTEAWARTVVRGAGPYDAVTFAERADQLALSYDASVGRSSMGLDASFPAANTEAALALFGRLVTEPRFDTEDFNNVREDMLDDLAAQVDQSDTVAAEVLYRALWPRHPWRLPALGTPATLSRIRAGRLATLHDDVTRPDNLVIGVAGGFDPDVVLAEIERWVELLEETASRAGIAPPGDPGPPRRTNPRTRFAGTQQATVLLGTRGVALDDPDRTPLAVSTAVLDSQAGRLFLQLREVHGLAYSVWARSESGLGGGTFSAGLATDPARVEEAARGLRDVVGNLARTGPDDAELHRVKRMLVGQAAMRLQRVSGRASELAWAERMGRPAGLDALRERLEAVTPTTVQAALERLGLDDAVIVRVLPRPNAEGGGR